MLDGTEFDSSYTRGVPATFKVNGVIPGWQEALVLMKPGAKWQLFIPPELAYDMRSPPGIPPGSMLIFDVDLVGVKPNAAPPVASPMPPQSHRAGAAAQARARTSKFFAPAAQPAASCAATEAGTQCLVRSSALVRSPIGCSAWAARP